MARFWNKNKEPKQYPADKGIESLLQEMEKSSGWNDGNNFKEVKDLFEKLADSRTTPRPRNEYGPEWDVQWDAKHKDYSELCDKLAESCQKYLTSHAAASSKSGKQRLDLVSRVLTAQKYLNCENAYDRIQNLENQEITLESAVEMTKRSREFETAYADLRKDDKFRSVITVENRDALRGKFDQHEARNLDVLRNPRALESPDIKGKTWRAARIQKNRLIVNEDTKVKAIGNGQSTRLLIEGERKGVFSQYYPNNDDEFFEQFVNNLPPEKVDIKVTMCNNMTFFTRFLSKAPTVSRIKEEGINDSATTFYKMLKESKDKGEQGDIQAKAEWEDLSRVAKDSAFLDNLYDYALSAKAFHNMHGAAKNAHIDSHNGGLDKRNILTSRLADMLDLGDIVTHSEEMEVVKDGQILKGCVMDFAEGMDVKTSNKEEFDKLSNLFLDTPEFHRAANRLSLFDHLCQQTDRHSGNFFYKTGEPGPDGKYPLIGITAIDNDMAFTINEKGGTLLKEQNIFIADKELAEKIMGLDRAKLEFLTGDVLNKEEIDALETRMNVLKEKFKTCTLIEKDDWTLDKYSNIPEEQRGEKEKEYMENINRHIEHINDEKSYDGVYQQARTIDGYLNDNKTFNPRSNIDKSNFERKQRLLEEAETALFGPAATNTREATAAAPAATAQQEKTTVQQEKATVQQEKATVQQEKTAVKIDLNTFAAETVLATPRVNKPKAPSIGASRKPLVHANAAKEPSQKPVQREAGPAK